MAHRNTDEGSIAGPVASLVDQCYGALTSGKCDWNQLEDLPQSMLISLLKRCAEERNELESSKEAQGGLLQQLEKEKERRYHVDPSLSSKRLSEYEGTWPSDPLEQNALQTLLDQKIKGMEHLLRDIRSKWQPEPMQVRDALGSAFSPNYPTHLAWSQADVCFTLANDYVYWGESLSRVISSAMLLYRTCCLFEVDVNTSDLTDRYKSVWAVCLWHVASGRKLCLSEHKGAATASLDWPQQEDPQLSSDFLQLMNLLCGQCPHTYDWTLAGAVA